MLMFVFLLSVSSIQKVWLSPARNNSELASTIKDEDLRSKRQATFFDLLHQAIEKYANCADEHLAPLKSLAAYKQYETLIPNKYSANNKEIVGAINSNSNKPKVKCTRVDLCTIMDQNSFKETADNDNPMKLGKPLDTKINISQLLPYFAINGNNKTKQPSYVGKPHGFGNVRLKHSEGYSHYNNLYKQGLLSLFLNKPTAASRKQIVKATEPEVVLGSALAKPPTTKGTSSCYCLENNSMEIVLNKTTTDAKLRQESGEDINRCPCLEGVNNQAQADNTRLADDEVLGSVANKNVLPNEAKEFDQNLNQLLMQLDEMAERANNGELREILEKLKNLKSAFDTDFENKEVRLSITTLKPIPVRVQAKHQQTAKVFPNTPHHFSLSKLGVGLLNTMFKIKSVTKAVKDENYGTAITKNNSHNNNVFKRKENVKSALSAINESLKQEHIRDVTSSDDSQLLGAVLNNSFSEFHILKDSSELFSEDFHAAVTETCLQEKKLHSPIKSYDFVEVTRTPALKISNSNSQNLKLITDDIRSLVSNMENSNLPNSRDFDGQESIKDLTRSPILALTHKNSKTLTHLDDGTDVLESSIESENLEDYYPESSCETITEPQILPFKILNKQKEMNTFVSSKKTFPRQSKNNYSSKRLAQDNKALKVNQNTRKTKSESPANSSKLRKKDSKITISITSNGNFKNIHVEQHVPDDTNLEINEKEKMNMAKTTFKSKSKDMLGTSSRFVTVVKQPQKIDSHAEPILSKIYPAKSEPSTKPPSSIYWDKIEKQPSKLKEAANGVWQTFQSSEIFDCQNCEEGSLAANLKTDIAHKDLLDTKGLNNKST